MNENTHSIEGSQLENISKPDLSKKGTLFFEFRV